MKIPGGTLIPDVGDSGGGGCLILFIIVFMVIPGLWEKTTGTQKPTPTPSPTPPGEWRESSNRIIGRYWHAYPTTPGAAPTAVANFVGEQFPVTRARVLKPSEIQAWSDSQRRYALNEVYARHGLNFTDPAVRETFSHFSWYRPNRKSLVADIESTFTSTEAENVRLIQEALRRVPSKSKPDAKTH
jgi:hypothetical protein